MGCQHGQFAREEFIRTLLRLLEMALKPKSGKQKGLKSDTIWITLQGELTMLHEK